MEDEFIEQGYYKQGQQLPIVALSQNPSSIFLSQHLCQRTKPFFLDVQNVNKRLPERWYG